MDVPGRRNGAEKRENVQAANRRLTGFIISYCAQCLTSNISQRTKCMSMLVQCDLCACTSKNPLYRLASYLQEHTHNP